MRHRLNYIFCLLLLSSYLYFINLFNTYVHIHMTWVKMNEKLSAERNIYFTLITSLSNWRQSDARPIQRRGWMFDDDADRIAADRRDDRRRTCIHKAMAVALFSKLIKQRLRVECWLPKKTPALVAFWKGSSLVKVFWFSCNHSRCNFLRFECTDIIFR